MTAVVGAAPGTLAVDAAAPLGDCRNRRRQAPTIYTGNGSILIPSHAISVGKLQSRLISLSFFYLCEHHSIVVLMITWEVHLAQFLFPSTTPRQQIAKEGFVPVSMMLRLTEFPK